MHDSRGWTLAGVLLLGSVLHAPAQVFARPVIPTVQELQRVPSGGLSSTAATLQPFEVTWFGGTTWAADSLRWEAIEDSVWTFESGVGSHFQHPPGSTKNPALHAQMEGWVGWDPIVMSEGRFRRRATTDFPPGPECVGAPAGLGGQYSFWAGVTQAEAESLCWVAGSGYGNDWSVCISREFTYAGAGNVTWEFSFASDTEPGFDYSYAIVDTSGGGDQVTRWVSTGVYSGVANLDLIPGESMRSDPGPFHLRFCVVSDPTYSDEDGLYATSCGAFAVDDVNVSGVGISYQTGFETGVDGWVEELEEPDPVENAELSHLVAITDLPEPDPGLGCSLGDSAMVFFDPDTGEHPPGFRNVAVSPWIDLRAAGLDDTQGRYVEIGGFIHAPLENRQFVTISAQWCPATCWAVGGIGVSECTTTDLIYYFDGQPRCSTEDRFIVDVSGVIPAGIEQVRIAVGVVNYCNYYSACPADSSTIWFDWVRFGVAQQGTIQAAINGAAEGDTVLVPPGTYKGPGNRDLDFGGKNLVLLAPAGPESTIIDCEGLGRGFLFQNGEDSTSVVQGFTILAGESGVDSLGDGRDGGGVWIVNASSPTFRDCWIDSCAATDPPAFAASGRGGGIFVSDSSAVFLEDCELTRNTASFGGAAVHARGPITLNSCRITNHESSYAIYAHRNATLSGCDLTNNDCYSVTNLRGELDIQACDVSGNTGIGLGVSSGATGLIMDCVFAGNGESGLRGFPPGQLNCESTVVVRDCIVQNNGRDGVEGCLRVEDSLVSGNGRWGVIGYRHIKRSHILNNGSPLDGGGVFAATVVDWGGFRLQLIEDCVIAGNQGYWGGGVQMQAGITDSLEIRRSTISGNTATRGGGIYANITATQPLRLNQVTLSGNQSDEGGGLYLESGRLEADRTILWGNCADSLGPEIVLAGTGPVATFTCSTVDTFGVVTGPGTLTYSGPQVFTDPLFCGPTSCAAAPTTLGDYTLASASPCLPAYSPCDSLIGAQGEGCSVVGVEPVPTPAVNSLAAYPNPSYGSMRVDYAAPATGVSTLEILDVRGRRVRSVVGLSGSGTYTWNGTDDEGRAVAAGVYFLRLRTPEGPLHRRIVLLR